MGIKKPDPYWLFLRGEIRTDGWKSDWRKTEERRRAEEMGERVFVAAPQIKERQKRAAPKPRIVQPKFTKCAECQVPVWARNKTGFCKHHKAKGPRPLKKTYPCGCCNKPMRKSVLGLCRQCFGKYRRRIEQSGQYCLECKTPLRRSTKYNLCEMHSQTVHSSVFARKRKAVRRELKKAA